MKIIEAARSQEQEVFEVQLRSGLRLLFALGAVCAVLGVFALVAALTGASVVGPVALFGVLVLSTLFAWAVMRSMSWQDLEVTVWSDRVLVLSRRSRHARQREVEVPPEDLLAVRSHTGTQKIQMDDHSVTKKYTQYQVTTSSHRLIVGKIEDREDAEAVRDRIGQALERLR